MICGNEAMRKMSRAYVGRHICDVCHKCDLTLKLGPGLRTSQLLLLPRYFVVLACLRLRRGNNLGATFRLLASSARHELAF